MINPYDITFGKKPNLLIDRPEIVNDIIDNISDATNGCYLYFLTGPRGSGKTVTMSSIMDTFKAKDDWITVDLNPHLDLQEQLAATLYQKGKMKHHFIDKEFSFSFHGITFSLSGTNPVTNIANLLNVLFEYLKKKGVRVLISIDEVTNNEHMRIFAHSFQSLLREGYFVSLIMTGLYENFSKLENDKGLTFLFRAPKIYMTPLNLRAIAYSYMDTLKMSEDKAVEASLLTKGYAFAFQLLGYFLFESGKKEVDEEILHKLDVQLEEKSYAKIYSELSRKEKEILITIAEEKKNNQEIMKALNMKNNSLSTYKTSLSRKGIIDISERGTASFALPRFKEFILFKSLLLK